jgi:zinc transporter, ZIP family
MIEAMAWSLLGASSLLIGALAAFWIPIGKRLLGMIMAFGAGVLISAVAYELVEEAVMTGAGPGAVAAGFASGAIVFYGGALYIDRRLAGAEAGGGGLAIVLGAVLDGVPESVVIGASLLAADAPDLAVIVAVFLSNIPEAIGASSDLVRGGWSRVRIVWLWVVVVAASTLAAGIGYAALEDASGSWIAAIQAFAAGGILTMLADEMLPEAFEYAKHNKSVGLAVAFGFAVAASMSFGR